jgi:hypothetical protein
MVKDGVLKARTREGKKGQRGGLHMGSSETLRRAHAPAVERHRRARLAAARCGMKQAWRGELRASFVPRGWHCAAAVSPTPSACA